MDVRSVKGTWAEMSKRLFVLLRGLIRRST
jgi:hypothetical protein